MTPNYIQHNFMVPSGPEALKAVIAGLGEDFRFEPHRIIADSDLVATHATYYVAEGSFVLTLAEGNVAKQPTAFYDLFRVDDGKIVEHWDVLQPIPEKLAHDNGPF